MPVFRCYTQCLDIWYDIIHTLQGRYPIFVIQYNRSIEVAISAVLEQIALVCKLSIHSLMSQHWLQHHLSHTMKQTNPLVLFIMHTNQQDIHSSLLTSSVTFTQFYPSCTRYTLKVQRIDHTMYLVLSIWYTWSAESKQPSQFCFSCTDISMMS